MRRLIVRAAGTVPRPIARKTHDAIIAAELAVEQARDRFEPPDDSRPDLLADVTAIVKTFERPAVIRRLVRSIHRRYPGLRIIVADDSRDPQRFPGVETIVLPYDSGVSVGRQAALDRVETTYVVVLDDDHVFYRHTRLGSNLATLEAHPEIDLLGGDEILLPFFTPSEFWRGRVYPGREPTREPGTTIAGLRICERVPAFFVIRTERLRLVGWDAQLRTLDHIDFFSRANGVLTTVFNPAFRVLHARTPFDDRYMNRRLDIESSLRVLAERYGEAIYELEGVPPDRFPFGTLVRSS